MDKRKRSLLILILGLLNAMGALQMGCGAIASALTGEFFNGTALPMTLLWACSVAGLSILLIGRKRIEYHARKEDVNEQCLELIEKY